LQVLLFDTLRHACLYVFVHSCVPSFIRSLRIYLKYISATFHADPIGNDVALGFIACDNMCYGVLYAIACPSVCPSHGWWISQRRL